MVLNYLAYGFLIVLYALFAWFGKAPVEGFLAVLGAGLTALGVHHVHQSAANRATDAANLANPVPPPKLPQAPTTITTSITTGKSQAGFARPFVLLMITVVMIIVLGLAACRKPDDCSFAVHQICSPVR